MSGATVTARLRRSAVAGSTPFALPIKGLNHAWSPGTHEVYRRAPQSVMNLLLGVP